MATKLGLPIALMSSGGFAVVAKYEGAHCPEGGRRGIRFSPNERLYTRIGARDEEWLVKGNISLSVRRLEHEE